MDDSEASWKSDEIRLGSSTAKGLATRASDYAQVLMTSSEDPADFSRTREWDRETLTSSLRTVHAPDVVRRFEATVPGHAEPISRLFRLNQNGVSSTLRAGTHYERGSFNA